MSFYICHTPLRQIRCETDFSKRPIMLDPIRFLATLRRLGARYIKDSSGQIAVVFALSIIPVAEGIGAAVDYSKAAQVRGGLQAALDAAVLAGAGDTTTNWKTTATNTFNGNFVPTTGTAA